LIGEIASDGFVAATPAGAFRYRVLDDGSGMSAEGNALTVGVDVISAEQPCGLRANDQFGKGFDEGLLAVPATE
jgi:hypothetical protein